jgi:hypothetical protein
MLSFYTFRKHPYLSVRYTVWDKPTTVIFRKLQAFYWRNIFGKNWRNQIQWFMMPLDSEQYHKELSEENPNLSLLRQFLYRLWFENIQL